MTNPAEQRDKQIKEMAEIIEKACSRTTCTNYECYECYAQALTNAGYLKPPELTVLDDTPFRKIAWAVGSNKAIKEALQAQRDHDAKIVKGE